MPLPSSINDLSTTAGSNSPAGSESPSTIDDYLRVYASYIAQLRDASQSNGFSMATAGGSANAITATYSPAVITLSDSTVLIFKATATNTGATTFSPNGLAAKPVVGAGHGPLVGGEIISTGEVCVQYNSSIGSGSWVILYSTGAAGTVVSQTLSAFTTTGTAPAFVLTPVPVLGAYAEPVRFNVKFHAAGTGADTLNISGLGAKNIKQYDSTGTKKAAVIAVGQRADVLYDGTDIVIIDPLPDVPPATNLTSILGAFKNLAGSTTGLNAAATFTADEIMVESASNTYQVLRAVSIAPSLANAIGVNGLDAGSVGGAASTWYSVWVIWNGTTVAGLFSTSATSPTMPSGYTHKALVGWVRTDATGNKYPLGMTWDGLNWTWKVTAATNLVAMPTMASGSVGSVTTPTWIAVAWANFAPPTAKRITVVSSNGSGTTIVAPNNAYGASTSVSNPSPVQNSGSANQVSVMADLMIESSNIYWASNAGGAGLFAHGGKI